MNKTINDFHVGDRLSLTPLGRHKAENNPEFLAIFDSGKCIVIKILQGAMRVKTPDGYTRTLDCFDWYEVKPHSLNELVQQ